MFYITTFIHNKRKTGFYLIKDNWDDFGYKTLYNLYFIDEKIELHEIGLVKIAKKNQEGGRAELEQSFKYLPPDYFSLGQSVDYYKNLKNLSDDLRIECLTSLNDISYDKKRYDDVEKELVTIDSLFRDVDRVTIKNQFTRIAHGGAILTPYSFSLRVNDDEERGELNFEVKTNTLPPTNIHTIIGTNGVGKTTILKKIVNEYFEQKFKNDFSNLIFISFSVFDKGESYKTNSDNRYDYVGVKNENFTSKSQEELRNEFTSSISKILVRRKHYYLHRMLEILASDINLSRFDLHGLLKEYIDLILNSSSTVKQQNVARDNLITDFKNIFDILSSGHQIILLSISKIVELIVEKTLILIDEPETHLHPPLLSSFIRAISEITTSENAVAILATHSPIVLQEVPKSCVSILRNYDGELNVQRPRFETFGENIGILTEEVFGLEILETGFNSLLKKVCQEVQNYEEVVESFNNELSLEAKSLVRIYLNENKKDNN